MMRNMLIAMGMAALAGGKIAYADDALTGMYMGLNAGVSLDHIQLESQHLGFMNPDSICDVNSNFSDFYSGIQLGYMRQIFQSAAIGIEIDGHFNVSQEDRMSCPSDAQSVFYDRFKFKDQGQISIKGRTGYSLKWNENVFLPYLTSGISFHQIGLTYENEGGDFYTNSKMKSGWVVGAGVEWSFKQHWSLRTEYNYTNYGDHAIDLEIPSVYGLQDPDGQAHVSLHSHTISASLSYWVSK